MKKILAVILGLCLAFTTLAFTACNDNVDDATVKFYAPDGAPALSIAKFINDKENFVEGVTIDYNVVSANDIGPKMSQGEGDLIVMPINAASKLYKANASDPYKMVSVVTHGNLYIMSSEEIGLADLKGKVIGVIGQGLVPDLTFKAVLDKSGLLDSIEIGETPIDGKIVIRYFAEASNMIPLLKSGQLSVGLLPESASTNLIKVANNITWHKTDLQELYDPDEKAYPQAVLMVKNSVLENYPELVSAISSKFADGVNWVKENPTLAVNAVSSVIAKGVTPMLNANNLTSQVVENCKIKWLASANAKDYARNYVNSVISVGVGLDIPPAKALSDDFFA